MEEELAALKAYGKQRLEELELENGELQALNEQVAREVQILN